MDREQTFDLLLPGYNYCGPFNKQNNGPPTNPTDAACKRHDEAYAQLGNRAYFYFNEADAILLEEIKDNTDYGAKVARAYFEAKRQASQLELPFDPKLAWTRMTKLEKWTKWESQQAAEEAARRGDRRRQIREGNLDDLTEDRPFRKTAPPNPIPMMDEYIPPAPTRPHETPTQIPTREIEVSPDGNIRRGAMKPRTLDMDIDQDNSSFDNSNPRAIMEGQSFKDTTPAMEGLRMAASGGTGKGNHETPITSHAPQYGLKETATVVLPWMGQCTIVGPTDYDEMTKLELRLNSPYDIVMTTINTSTPPQTFNMGVFDRKYPRAWDSTNGTMGMALQWNGSGFPATALNYPMPMSNSEIPQWRTYWERHYKVYAVIETEVTVRIKPLINSVGNRQGVVGYGTDVSSLDGVRVNNKFPDRRRYKEMVHWPGVSWKRIDNTTESDKTGDTVVRFNWKPGNLNKPVTNDEDVKTWTNNGSVPSMIENMVLWFGKSWENQSAEREVYAVQVEYRQIVQFKDLDVNAYYPTANTWSLAPSLNGGAVPSQVLQVS